jgi:hypothetical protein
MDCFIDWIRAWSRLTKKEPALEAKNAAQFKNQGSTAVQIQFQSQLQVQSKVTPTDPGPQTEETLAKLPRS